MPKITKYPRLRSHIRKRRNGEVRVYYFYDMRPEGEPDIALGCDFGEAVSQWDELHNKKPRAKGRLQEAIDRWRRDVLPNYINAETRKSYEKQLARVEAPLGGMVWEEITLPILHEYLSRRKAKTQGNREMAVLSIVWKKALLWGMTRCPWPAQGIKDWKNPESARVFKVTDELFEAVYKFAEPMLRDAMDIATATGMRITDARTVLMPKGNMLYLKASKTNKEAVFDITASKVLPDIVKRRKALQADHMMLLSMPNGAKVSYRMMSGAYDRARQAAMRAFPELAQQIKAMWLRDMRKRASKLAGELGRATALLQHDNEGFTQKHYPSEVRQLKPVR